MQSAGSQADSARKPLTYRHADRSTTGETDVMRDAVWRRMYRIFGGKSAMV
jgi:hypothetical protein